MEEILYLNLNVVGKMKLSYCQELGITDISASLK